MLLAGSTRYFVYDIYTSGDLRVFISPTHHQTPCTTFVFFSVSFFLRKIKIFDRNAWRVTASPSEEKHRSDPFVGFFSSQFPKSKIPN